jgi:hypothetical protein
MPMAVLRPGVEFHNPALGSVRTMRGCVEAAHPTATRPHTYFRNAGVTQIA